MDIKVGNSCGGEKPGKTLVSRQGEISLFQQKDIIGIGGNLAIPPLPHHHAYGSVRGGSMDLS